VDAISERFRRVAAGFSERAQGEPEDAWEQPSPCEGWTARDVVRHLVEWVPAFFEAAGAPSLPPLPSPHDDPAGAWEALRAGVQGWLDDPELATSVIEHPRAGRHALCDAVGTFVVGDVLVHTWDLARATGQDETLDPDEVARTLAGSQPVEELMRSSGQYGPRVEVPTDADLQARLIAFTGRQP